MPVVITAYSDKTFDFVRVLYHSLLPDMLDALLLIAMD